MASSVEQSGNESLAGMRILIGPTDTASFPSRLARGLADRGAKVWLLNLSPHMYNADTQSFGDAKLWASGWVRSIARLNEKGFAGRALAGLIKEILRVVTFMWSLWAINSVVFVSSRSIFRTNLDLWFYRLLGKRVIRVFLGTDSRPRYMSGWHHRLLDPKSRASAASKLAKRVRRQRRRVCRVSRWSSVVIDNPLCGHYQERPYVNWFFIGFPHDESVYGSVPEPRPEQPGKLRVLHCPSNPIIKGTDRIDAAIAQLIGDGIPIEYTKITGMPHAEVLQRLSECDLVVDELYSDSPMAGFASEAAAFGKSALVCGYCWDLLRQYLPEDMFPPNLLFNPDDFETVLPQVIADADLRKRTGTQAYEFINSQWRQEAVVDRFAKIIAGDDKVPAAWWFDPAKIEYWQGLGATQDHRKQALLAFCREQGVDALMAPANSPFLATVKQWLADESAE